MDKKTIQVIEGASGSLRKLVSLSEEESTLVLTKALQGGESDLEHLEEWVKGRFAPSCVQINKDEYARVCVNALKSIFGLAATDYGSSRQRDMGQLWADVICTVMVLT